METGSETFPDERGSGMAVKPDGKAWTIREQIFTDRATGLTFQFEVMPDGEPLMRVFGDDLPLGNREYFFNANGAKTGSGGATGLCRPAWLGPIDA
jgi:hypothetical protein